MSTRKIIGSLYVYVTADGYQLKDNQIAIVATTVAWVQLPSNPVVGNTITLGGLSSFYVKSDKPINGIMGNYNLPMGTSTVQNLYFIKFVYANNTIGWLCDFNSLYAGNLEVYKSISTKEAHSLALKNSDGTAWSWGYNISGQLGNNSRTNYSSPISVVGGNSYTRISAGNSHSLAIRGSDGTAWSWGDNAYGQLGTNDTVSYSSPISIKGENSYIQISAGDLHSLAIKYDGTVWAWGYNASGNLGTNNTTSYSSPVQIAGTNSYTQISAGNYFSLAIKTDGTIWSWGDNTYGILGNNSRTNYSSPIQVSATGSYTQVSAGNYFGLALKGDGTVWAWGYNASGNLGTNNTTSYSSPVQIAGTNSYTQISAGHSIALAIKYDGTIWAWGYNAWGQLATNNTISYSSPISIITGSSYTQISAGGSYCLAIKEMGNVVWSWGNNGSGQLGNNTTINTSSPVLV